MTVTDEQLAEWERLAGSGYVGLYPVILTIRSAVTLLIAAVRAEREENGRLRVALEDMARQFAWSDGLGGYWTGDQPVLERVFAVLGWSNPTTRPTTGGDDGT